MTLTSALRRRHRDFYLQLIEELMKPVVASAIGWEPEVGDAEERTAAASAELDNLRMAIAWSLDVGDTSEACRLAVAAHPVWIDNELWAEGKRWLTACIAATPSLPQELMADALFAHSLMRFRVEDYAPAIEAAERSARIRIELGDRRRDLIARNHIAWTYFYDARPAIAHPIFEEVTRAAADAGDVLVEAQARFGLGWALVGVDNDRGLREHDRVLELLDDDPVRMTGVLPGIAAFRSRLGLAEESLRLRERGARLAAEMGLSRMRVVFLIDIARSKLDHGNVSAAVASLEEALGVARASHDTAHVPEILRWMARAAVREGRAGAARLLATEALEALRARPELGFSESVLMPALLDELGGLCVSEGDLGRAQAYAEETLEVARRDGNIVREQVALYNVATLAELRGNLRAAQELLEQALNGASRISDPVYEMHEPHVEAHLRFLRGEAGPARAAAARALELGRRSGLRRFFSAYLTLDGRIALQAGDHTSALRAFDDAAHEALVGQPQMRVTALVRGAHAALRAGDLDGARTRLRMALAEFNHRHAVLEVEIADALAGLADAAGDEALALRLFMSADGVRARIGLGVRPEDAAWRVELLERLRSTEAVGHEPPGDLELADVIAAARRELELT
jgi:tetratricopeptide (TPR) repeat protein